MGQFARSNGTDATQIQNNLQKQATRVVHSEDFLDNLEAMVNDSSTHLKENSGIDQAQVLVVDDN